jgi:hypothetical protein
MPTSFNINSPLQGLNINVRSVNCWFWPGVIDQSAEVASTASHYVVFEGFTSPNLGGVSLGRGSLDTGGMTAIQMYQAATVQEVFTKAFV